MANTTTPARIHAAVTAALADRAAGQRKIAAGHGMTGPAYAGTREALRAEARLCEDLQRILGHVTPEALASVLEARP